MVRIWLMVASGLVVSVGLGACSDNSSKDASSDGEAIACVDFVATDADLECSVAADCSWVNALHLCPGDYSCGPQNPVNKVAAARYHAETSAVPLKNVFCAEPSPVGCIMHRCAIVGFDSDAAAE